MKQPDSLHTVIIVLALSYFPHVLWLPAWVSVFCFSLWAIRFLAAVRRWKAPGRLYLYGLTLLALAGVALFGGGTFYGREAGASLLALMLAVKPFEIRTYRDRMISLFLALFLLFTTLLFTQSLFLGIYLLISLMVIATALMLVNQPQPRLFVSGSQALLLCLQALPLAAIFFVLFPRLPGALIGLRNADSVSITGLSETLSPGSLSELVQSDAIAFRAEFTDPPPDNRHLYWRAAVLWDFNGTTWTRGGASQQRHPDVPFKETQTTYTVALEPTGTAMLPALDIPLEAPPQAALFSDWTLKAHEKIQDKTNYRMRSSLNFSLPPPDTFQIERGLALDTARNPRTQALMASMTADSPGPAALVQQVLQYFRQQGFAYTLSPPMLRSRDSVDEFLFRTRRGYCSHYAQALTWMMRCAGVPARIVVGYQGGEQNPLGDYLIVRQSDAHAWVELALPGQGWTRVDPTQAVAPDRIASGMQQFLTRTGEGSLFMIDDDHWLMQIGHSLQLSWDALNYHWYTWVVDYTLAKQNRLLSRLHFGENIWRSLDTVILIMTASALLFVLASALLILPARSAGPDAVKHIYSRFLKKLQKYGLDVPSHEGPRDQAQRIARRFPHRKADIKTISDMYIQLRYADVQDKHLLRQFRKRIRAFDKH